MRFSNQSDGGVSEVVGEMLMIALVVVLLSIFSAALYTFLPMDRDPTVSVMLSNDNQNITLWHKGGDEVNADDLTVSIGNNTLRQSYSKKTGGIILVPMKPAFDLGSNITVTIHGSLKGDETVKLTTPHLVLFTGKVSL